MRAEFFNIVSADRKIRRAECWDLSRVKYKFWYTVQILVFLLKEHAISVFKVNLWVKINRIIASLQLYSMGYLPYQKCTRCK